MEFILKRSYPSPLKLFISKSGAQKEKPGELESALTPTTTPVDFFSALPTSSLHGTDQK